MSTDCLLLEQPLPRILSMVECKPTSIMPELPTCTCTCTERLAHDLANHADALAAKLDDSDWGLRKERDSRP